MSTVINNTLYLEVIGTDNNHYYKSSANGVNFSDWMAGTVNAETTSMADVNGLTYDFGQGEQVAQPHLCVNTSPVIATQVSNVELVQMVSPLDINPGNGNPNSDIGLRIFPDKTTPTDLANRAKVRVQATIFPIQPNVPVHFKTYDMDDPSANILPLDDETQLQDNRGSVGGFKQGMLNTKTVMTNSSGIATVELTVTKQPGDNFAVAASRNSAYLTAAKPVGSDLKNGTNVIPISGVGTPPATPLNPAIRTQLLTVWRKLHIEVDDMGVVQNDPPITGTLSSPITIEFGTTAPYPFPLPANTEDNHYEGGHIYFSNNQDFKISSNDVLNNVHGVSIRSNLTQNVTIPAGTTYTIWEDDDFNSNDGTPTRPFHMDNGEDVFRESEIFDAIQEADNIPNQTPKNVYASAYIKPEYGWATTAGLNGTSLNNNNVTFNLNINTETAPAQTAFQTILDSNRGSSGKESNDFWIAYVLVAYQADPTRDCDGIQGECDGGVGKPSPVSNTVTNSSQVQQGPYGTFVFVEDMKDELRSADGNSNRNWLTAVPHEIGHQFGIWGDLSGNSNWNIMGYKNLDYNFHPEHINIMRWRISSPGKP